MFGIVAAGSSLANLGGAYLQSEATKDAANTQAAAGDRAIAEQARQYNQSRADLAPYRELGQQALFKLSDYLGLPQPNAAPDPITGQPITLSSGGGFLGPVASAIGQVVPQPGKPTPQPSATSPSATTGSLLQPFSFDISKDPGYQFRLGQGEQAIENSTAARGSQLSGATLKELLRYGQDYASGEFNAAFQRDQATKAQVYGLLTGAAGMGQGATTTGVQAGQASAANIGNTITGIGNAQAAGQIGQANAWSNAFSNTTGTIGQSYLLSQILGKNNPGVAGVNQGVDLSGQGIG